MVCNCVQPYLASILVALAAIPLGLSAGAAWAAGALILAAVSFIQTGRLLNELDKTPHQESPPAGDACAAQVFRTVDELSAGIAHEINNPLGIIAQETEWIQHLFETRTLDDLRETDDCKDSLREISRQVDRCKEIVQKLLSLARHMKPVMQNVDLNGVIRTMIDLAQRDASDKNIKIIGRLEPDLPFLSSDPPLLRQVLLNLLVNAAQAIEKDGTITVTTRKIDDELVEVTVEDNGCGIPSDQLSHIFNPFFSTKPLGKGTGLGLALCRGIVETLGGTISVRSDPGKYTVFAVRLRVHSRGEGGEPHAD
jgi:two-component system, NtrC family, sensor kinase